MNIKCFITFNLDVNGDHIENQLADTLGVARQTACNDLSREQYNQACDYYDIPSSNQLIPLELDFIDPDMLHHDAIGVIMDYFSDFYGFALTSCVLDSNYFNSDDDYED